MYLFLKFYMIEVIQSVVFCAYLLSPSMLVKFICVGQNLCLVSFYCWIRSQCMGVSHLSIHPPKNTWVVSTRDLLRVMLLWTFMHWFFMCTHVFISPEYMLPLELLGYVVTLFNFFLGIAKPFSKVTAFFYIFTSNCLRVRISPNLHQFWWFSVILFISMVACVKWYLIAVLIFVPLND